MAVAFVKAHTVVSEKVLDTSASVQVDTGGVAAGNLLVLAIVFDNAGTASKPVVSSITKQAGETASWVSLGSSRSTSTSIGAFASAELWAIKTTVAWSAATYTVTLDTAVTMKAAGFVEFSGAEATVRSTTGTAYSTTTTAASAATTGTTPVIGDLAVGFLFGSNIAAAPAADTDTTGGSWSSVIGVGSTGSSGATNNFGILQYKVLTAASHQTFNSSAAGAAGNGSIVAILQATPPPAITQAAYRWYDEGTEQGPATLADSYSETNRDANLGFTVATNTAQGQSFLGDGRYLVRAGFYLVRPVITSVGTGTLTAQLYAHSGTFGSGVPTGSALATAAVTLPTASVDSTTHAWFDFEFDGTYQLANGTPYFVTLTTTNTVTNAVAWGADTTTSTHAGNLARAFNNGAWTAQPQDGIFRVYTSPLSGYAALGALAAQDTAVTGDITNGDATGTLRIRLQETGSGPVPVTDDFQLQWERNSSGTWVNVGTLALIDSNPVANYTGNATALASDNFTRVAHSFVGTGQNLSRAGFYLLRSLSPDGDLKAELYAHAGSFGTTGLPTGSPLATSATLLSSSVSSSAFGMVYFDFDGTYQLSNGTPYFLAITSTTTVPIASGRINVGQDNTPSHAGNSAQYISAWAVASPTAFDLVFEVYSPAGTVRTYDSPNLTNGQATTNRLTGGTGTFVPGKVSEDALMDDLGWTTGNYTELVYALKIIAADLVHGDSLRFRVLRNGATTTLTYTQTPTINLIKSLVPNGTGAGTYDYSRTTATGYKAPKATATAGTYLWARTTATGYKVQRGTAPAGTYAWDRTAATGTKPLRGSAVGTYAFDRTTATGYKVQRGTTTAGTYLWARTTVTGTTTPRGQATTGTYLWARTTATGTTTPRGQSTAGTYRWSGIATGLAPAVGTSAGTATGAYLWARTTVTGTKTPRGTTTGAYAWDRTTATGIKAPKGTATTGTYLWARTTATGYKLPKAATTGAYAFDRTTATGTKTPRAAAVGAYLFAGTSAGSKTPRAAAVGTYAWARTTATGTKAPRGTTTGTYAWNRTAAAGTQPVKGTAAGTYSWARAAATGYALPKAQSATGTWNWSGVAAGFRPIPGVKQGSAIGTYAWNRTTATGTTTPKAAATGAYAYAGTAAGVRVQRGTAAASYAYNRTAATGTKTPRGATTGTYLWARTTATGYRTAKASTTGTYLYVGTGTGLRPAVAPKRGTAAGTYQWAGVTTGRTSPRGVAAGTYLYTGTATGATALYVTDFAGNPLQVWVDGTTYPVQLANH